MEVLTLDFFKMFFKNYFISIFMLLILHDLSVFILKNNKYTYMLPLIPFGIVHSLLVKNWLLRLINPFVWFLIIVPYSTIVDLFLMFNIKINIMYKGFTFKRNSLKELKKFNKSMEDNFKDVIK